MSNAGICGHPDFPENFTAAVEQKTMPLLATLHLTYVILAPISILERLEK